MTERLGQIIDHKYRLIRLLGEGGMGIVYEGEHVILGRRVAVKMMHEEKVSRPESVERFFQEARAASAIGHPNIVDIHDVGRDDDGAVFIVMELLKGMNLADYMDMEGRIDQEKAVSIALQTLSALRASHAKNIIHRDLKSENIFLAVGPRGREEVKLLDFGIAKIVGEKKDFRLSTTGDVMGTPYHLAPEQARGGKGVDHRVDIWGVGVMLYEMLTGRLPYTGDNYNEIISLILLEPPRPISEISPDASPALVEAVEKAMAKDPNDRFADCDEMIDALEPFCSHSADLMSTAVFRTIKSGRGRDGAGERARETGPRADDSEQGLASTGAGMSKTLFRRNVVLFGMTGLAILLLAGMGIFVITGASKDFEEPIPVHEQVPTKLEQPVTDARGIEVRGGFDGDLVEQPAMEHGAVDNVDAGEPADIEGARNTGREKGSSAARVGKKPEGKETGPQKAAKSHGKGRSTDTKQKKTGNWEKNPFE